FYQRGQKGQKGQRGQKGQKGQRVGGRFAPVNKTTRQKVKESKSQKVFATSVKSVLSVNPWSLFVS
ncbi:MAG: hypothetical protein ACI4TS_00605, partial [Bacteroidaceae bacterium]